MTQRTHTYDLKPCPFCGAAGTIVFDQGNEVYGQSWVGKCTGCRVHTEKCFGSSSWAANAKQDNIAKQNAVAAWNRRTPPLSAQSATDPVLIDPDTHISVIEMAQQHEASASPAELKGFKNGGWRISLWPVFRDGWRKAKHEESQDATAPVDWDAISQIAKDLKRIAEGVDMPYSGLIISRAKALLARATPEGDRP